MLRRLGRAQPPIAKLACHAREPHRALLSRTVLPSGWTRARQRMVFWLRSRTRSLPSSSTYCSSRGISAVAGSYARGSMLSRLDSFATLMARLSATARFPFNPRCNLFTHTFATTCCRHHA